MASEKIEGLIHGLRRIVGFILERFRSAATRLWTWVRRDPRASGSTAAIALAAVAVVVAMVLADGFRARTYDLEESAVWVVNQDAQKFGRINTQIGEQDAMGGVEGDGGGSDVVQNGRDVFVRAGVAWLRVDPRSVATAEGDSGLFPGSSVKVGGGRIAVMDPAGAVWVGDASQAELLKVGDGGAAKTGKGSAKQGDSDSKKAQGSKARPTVKASGDAVFAVGTGGDVAVLSGQSGNLTVVPKHGKRPPSQKLEGFKEPKDAQVSMVGSDAVVLSGSTLFLPNGKKVEVPGADPRLQLPGDDPTRVIVASGNGVFSFATSDGQRKALHEGGALSGVAAPVNVGGLIYAAWAGPEASVLYRSGAQQVVMKVSDTGLDLPAGSELVWRVNRTRVALNEVKSGAVLTVLDGKLVRSDSWDEKTSPSPSTSTPDSKDKNQDLVFDPKDHQPPLAEPDEAGAREGIPSIVDVLANDTDPNSDPLTVVDIDAVSGGKVELVQGGQAVQVTPDGKSPVTFTYAAFDGLLKSNVVNVTVTPSDGKENNPPVLRKDVNNLPRQLELTVGATKTASYNIVSNYEDPEGDPIILRSASVDEAAGAKVSFQSGGLVTYTDTLGEAGTRSVHFEVADVPQVSGVNSAATKADLPVTVTAAGVNSAPIARYDYAQVLEGQSVVVWPLHNDNDPDGDTLTYELLPKKDDPEQKLPAGVVQNSDGSVTVTATTVTTGADGQPIPFLFGYEVTDGPNRAQARIRVDVVPKSAPPQPPSAGLDLVVLPRPTGNGAVERTVDLLMNDFSPSGRVLVVTSVEAPRTGLEGFKAQLLEHRRLRVSYPAELRAAVTLTYTVSDGQNSATGRVVVVSSTQTEQLVPTAVPDSITVRAGDAVNIPVLSNDIDPSGGKLYLHHDIEGMAEGGGLAFVAGDNVRFLAPDKATSVRFSYYLTDKQGITKRSPGEVTVRVQKLETNTPPVPPMIEARVLSGSSVRITIPLSGVDPDGDSVRLLGLGYAGGMDAAPKYGQITQVGVDYLIYEAFEGESGTDEFRYRVVDTGGPTGKPAEAEGTIRVGVAPRPSTGNQAPVAIPDEVKIRPGGQLLFNPLLNDFDPDGDVIGFAAKNPLSAASTGLDVSITKEGRLLIKAPSSAGSYSVLYKIQDSLQTVSTDWTKVAVKVDGEAAGLPPVAKDDVAEGQADQQTVSVKVLENDDDPDGDPAKLKVHALTGYPGTPTADGRSFEVPITASSQVVPYEVVDEQGLTAIAFVRVRPASAEKDKPPVLKAGQVIEVTASKDPKPLSFKLADYVEDPDGKEVRFTKGSSISKHRGVDGNVVDATSFTVTAPKIVDAKDVAGLIGDAAVNVVVTDTAEGADEHPVMLQIPVKVKADENLPPKWKPIGQVRLTRNDTEPSDPTDLSQLASDPEGEALKFSVDEIPDGVQVKRENDVLTFVGSTKLTKDASLAVKLSVKTDRNPKPVEATLMLLVIDTLQPPATLASFNLDAELGKAVKIDTLEGSMNPFDDVPLNLDASSVTVSTGQGQAPVNGNQISFTPEKVGPATISYLVVDKVGRKVPSTATFTVRDKPAKVSQPSVVQLSSRSVEVRFDSPVDNGSPIEKYTVKADTGAKTDCGTQLVCTVTGLTPAQTYTFTVTATNKIGESEPSTPSPQITPDECAGAPKNVTLLFDAKTNAPNTGGQLDASWEIPDNDGSAIEDYEIKITGPGSHQSITSKDTKYTIKGLQNGGSYTISVRARNKCKAQFGEPAESAPAVPAAIPSVPANVQANRIDNPVGGRVFVTWSAYKTEFEGGAPNTNGDPIIKYEITPVQGGGSPRTVQAADVASSGGQNSVELSVDKNGGPYRFTVTATNKAGSTTASVATDPLTAHSPPAVPTGLKSWANVEGGNTGMNGNLRIEFYDPSDKGGKIGVSIVRRQYSLNGGGWTDFPYSANGSPFKATIGGLNNGSQYSLAVRVLNQGEGNGAEAEMASDPTAPISGAGTNSGSDTKPYGPLPVPYATAIASGTTVNFAWDARHGTRGTNVVRSDWSGSISGSKAGSSGSGSAGGAYSTPYGFTVVFTDDRGQQSSAHAEARTVDPPPPPDPSIVIRWGGAGSDSSGQGCGAGAGCQWIVGDIYNFPANQVVDVQCKMDGVTYMTVKGIRVRSDGGGGWGTGWCLGKPNTSNNYTATWSSAESNPL